MSEVRGYPNPNYRMQDVGLEPLEMNAQICLDDKEYRELVTKAAAFDVLVTELKSKIDYGYSYSLVDTDFVLQVTGMSAYQRKKEWEERQKTKEDSEDGED